MGGSDAARRRLRLWRTGMLVTGDWMLDAGYDYTEVSSDGGYRPLISFLFYTLAWQAAGSKVD